VIGEADYWNDHVWLRPHAVTRADWDKARAINKRVGSGRWVRAHRAWRYPATTEVCLRLREGWGQDLRIRHDLADWYREAKLVTEQQALRSTLSDATLVRLPQVAPRLFSTLRPDQRSATAWFAAGYRGGGLLADQPGTGKTLVSIAGILESGYEGPVLCLSMRLAVRRVWEREWRKWTDVPVFAARGTRARRERVIRQFFACPATTKVLICVHEMVRVQREPASTKTEHKRRGRIIGYQYPELFDEEKLGGGWSWIVTDESHRLLGSLTIAKANMCGEGAMHLPLRLGSGQRRAVTGTPWGKGGRVQGLFGTLTWMWPDEFTSFWKWAGRYFAIEEEEVYIRGGHGQTKTTYRVGELLAGDASGLMRDLGPRIMRRTKEEVLPFLPPKQYIEVMCDLVPAQVKQYAGLDRDAEFLTPNGPVTVNGSLAFYTRARQIADGALSKALPSGKVVFSGESGKLDQLFEFLEERNITNGLPQTSQDDIKLVVASQYNEFLYALEARLEKAKIPYYLLTGKTSDRERDRMMDAFQELGGPRLFLINSEAGGISVTLDAADELHLLDEQGDPGDNEQVEDRIHRASRIHSTRIYLYRSEGTIDEAVGSDTEGKRIEQWKVLDGRRGLEYMRELIRYRPKKDEE
jgi:Zierdtviridae DNA helicase